MARAPVGFSGTNVAHRLLPRSVKCDWDAVSDTASRRTLCATDGRILALILARGTYRELRPSAAAAGGGGGGAHAASWHDVVALAVAEGASALIDAGALLAGVPPRDVARRVWRELQAPRAGAPAAALPRLAVVFNEGGGAWWALNADGCVPMRKAPVAERDAFVVFGEQDCRGVDKALRDDALAVLTLGPRLWKSTLVQAAGRMRRLAAGQRLLLVGTDDVHAQLLALAGSDSGGGGYDAGALLRAVPRWALRNSVDAEVAGLAEWQRHGAHAANTVGAPASAALIRERTTLEALYTVH